VIPLLGKHFVIHANPNLQKFNYLKVQLQGDVNRATDRLLLSDLHAVTLLQDHFGQPHELVNAYMKALVSMACPTNKFSILKMFYDSVESHIHDLSLLGKSEKSYGDLLVPIIMNKLTNEVRCNLAREHSNTQWVVPDLMAVLQKEIRVPECSSQNPYNPVSNIFTAAFQINAEDGKGHPTTHGNTSKKKGLVCAFCKGPHPTHTCESVTDHHKRLEIVKTENLCFNCLAHHKVSQCQLRF